ncbi:MFS transporter [Actinoallomurus purpureus]|uniref:MFS transporter n=1 Tax=Actinoallomurus purpureus TaxID=478114 RepID=UPI002092750B|nr:MFS transporter [Actinoallomurus purpureus]MCO6003514.1 MFS transporter [Actinoallomurus purpureus]
MNTDLAQADSPARDSKRNPFAWTFTAPLYVGSSLNPINSSIIATALVPIATGLHVSVGSTSVLVTSLYLTSAIAQPTAGKLAEVLGPRRVFLGGILLVLLGGLVGGFGQNLAMLTVARVLVGVGTSAGFPSAMVLIRRRAVDAGLKSPPGGVLGGIAVTGMATVAIGPPIGGLLVGTAGWRWAFLINIPVTALAMAMAVRWVPRDPVREGGPRGFREVADRIDLPGILGFAAAMTSLIIFLMSLPHADWYALAAFVVVAVPTVWWELRTTGPFFDLRGLAANGALGRTYLRQAFTLLGIYTVMYGMTQWMEAARGISAQDAGLLLLPMGAVSALLSRPLASRNLVRGPLIASAATMLAGSIGIVLLTSHSPVVAIVLVSLIFGVTSAVTTVGNQTALYLSASPEQIGTASGLFRTFGYLGTIVSAVATSIVFRDGVKDHGLHTLGVVLVAAGVVVLLLTVLDRRLMGRPDRNQHTVTEKNATRNTSKGEQRVSTTAAPTIDPKRTALLAMDFQNGIVAHVPDPEALIERVNGAITKVRAAGCTIGYVRVAFTEDDWAAVPETNKTFAAAAAAKMLHHEDTTTQINERITPQEGDIVVRKVRFGGISTTDLDQQLRDRGIDTLVLSGISTSGVVLSTLIDAADRDYRVYVLSDGVADPDTEAHEVLMNNVFPSRAHVIDTTQLHELLRSA